jgi:hypothetical protein
MKIAFGMIVFEGDYVLKECLESIYPFASQILIAEGPVTFWQQQGRTTSLDDTNVILENFPDPENKITIVHGQFKEKDEQCNAYMKHLKDDIDYFWQVDSDEVYKSKDIEKVIELLVNEKPTSLGVKSCSFYGGFNNYISGFEEATDNFLRIFKVYPGSKWLTHRPPTMMHQPDISVLPIKHINSDELYDKTGVLMYHYSYVFPSQVSKKIFYYKAKVSTFKCIDNYFEKIYLPWVKGSASDRFLVEGLHFGVHEFKPEFRGPARTKIFEGKHPKLIQDNLPSLENRIKKELEKYEN